MLRRNAMLNKTVITHKNKINLYGCFVPRMAKNLADSQLIGGYFSISTY